jgi:hypothetical protein
MKKYLILFLYFWAESHMGFAQSGPVNRLAKKIVKALEAEVKSNPVLKGKKVVVLPFGQGGGESDSIPGCIGFELAAELESQILNRKIPGLELLVLKGKADDLMKNKTFDDYKSESMAWKKAAERAHPDFYLWGKVMLNAGMTEISALQIKLEQDKFQENLKPLGLETQVAAIGNSSEKLALLNCQKVNSLDALCRRMALQISAQTKIKNIQVSAFTFQDTDLATPFSNFLSDKFAGVLGESGEHQVTRVSFRGFWNGRDKTPYRLRGRYSIVDSLVRFQVNLVNSENGSFLLAMDGALPLNSLKETGLVYVPQVQAAAVQIDSVLQKEKIKNNFQVDIWTNKGNDNIVLRNGEQVQFFVYAHKPCYIRLLYLMADGSKILLLENFKIDDEKAGKEITVDPKFECSEPFGKETLILNAQNQPFAPLHTSTQNGYTYILDDIANVVRNNRRGLKAVLEKSETSMSFLTHK